MIVTPGSAAAAYAAPAEVAAPAQEPTILPITYVKQCQTEWCWAACGFMVIHCYYSTSTQQCDLANWMTDNQYNCCTYGSSSFCNSPAQAKDVRDMFTGYQLKCDWTTSALEPATCGIR